jgi:hypothetical protein
MALMVPARPLPGKEWIFLFQQPVPLVTGFLDQWTGLNMCGLPVELTVSVPWILVEGCWVLLLLVFKST